MVRENPFAWLIATFNCSVLTYIWFSKGIVGLTLLYFFYVCNSIFAFSKWKKRDKNNNFLLKVKRVPIFTSIIQIITLIILITIIVLGINYLKTHYGFISNKTILDITIVVFSLYALILQVYKNVESWLYFTIIDALVCCLYIQVGLYLLALVKGYIAIMSGYGFIRWVIKYKRIQMQKQVSEM